MDIVEQYKRQSYLFRRVTGDMRPNGRMKGIT